MYRTVGVDADDNHHTLYAGDDPVAAVEAGLTAPDTYLETHVTENGVIIPETVAH